MHRKITAMQSMMAHSFWAFVEITATHSMMTHCFWRSRQLQKCTPGWCTAFGIHGNYSNAFHDGTAFGVHGNYRNALQDGAQLLAFTAITVMHSMMAHSSGHSYYFTNDYQWDLETATHIPTQHAHLTGEKHRATWRFMRTRKR